MAWLSGVFGGRSGQAKNYVDYIPLNTQQVDRDSPLTPAIVSSTHAAFQARAPRDSQDSDMVSYGSAGDQDDHAEASSSTGGLRTPLLAKTNGTDDERATQPGVVLDADGRRQGNATLASGIGNLANTIIGSGASYNETWS